MAAGGPGEELSRARVIGVETRGIDGVGDNALSQILGLAKQFIGPLTLQTLTRRRLIVGLVPSALAMLEWSRSATYFRTTAWRCR